ncbi:HEAT repeat domain-containing protein [Sphingosinicella rhizophila]|uniref:HEAT repeat domain-containing protein n=1 Tax=Sphingosinicella rhizophila TaxID=3050082 RepID=A0ABU3QAN3_9SPHN|nr:HEAT repeat domain-containing protein [Sphingosinicella sp. GR2756]MDT9600465.1 HEAT repeat domain-containing protein [Sphingosinicella sp. GR2756]
MIASETLAAWLFDPARQLATGKSVIAFARKWQDHPLVRSLKQEIDALPVKTAAALVAAAGRFMGEEAEFESLLRDIIANSKADPFFRAPFRLVSNDIHSGLLLFDDPALSISLGVIGLDALAHKKLSEDGGSAISFTGQWTVIKFLKAGGATLSFWEAPAIDGDFVAEKGGSCRFVERRTIEDGEILVTDGRSQSYVIEHATSDIICAQALIGAESAPLALSYDWKSLEFAGASSTDEQACRSHMMVTLLRMMDRKDAVPVVRDALKDQHFYTRWQIMREFLALDAEAALPVLRDMAREDPHPEIRQAAQQTLARFFPDDVDEDQEIVACPA